MGEEEEKEEGPFRGGKVRGGEEAGSVLALFAWHSISICFMSNYRGLEAEIASVILFREWQFKCFPCLLLRVWHTKNRQFT